MVKYKKIDAFFKRKISNRDENCIASIQHRPLKLTLQLRHLLISTRLMTRAPHGSYELKLFHNVFCFGGIIVM